MEAIALSEQKTFDGIPFPMAYGPKLEGGSEEEKLENMLKYIKENKSTLEESLLKHGVLYFRGFPTKTPENFNKVVEAFGFENFPYVGGAAPRRHIVGNVFSSNESPPECAIPFHHEMAQVPIYPKKLFFYCDCPSSQGGETPLLLSNEVYKRVNEKHPQFVKNLLEKGVKYIRVLPEEDDPTSAIGRGWKATFQVKTKEEAEEKCRSLGTTFEWVSETEMKTISTTLPAIKKNPKRNDLEIWFNSIVAAYTGWNDSRNKGEEAVVFGDGAPLPKEEVLDTAKIMDEVCVSIIWEHGDFCLVDNDLAMHARKSFVPPRRVYAALCK